MRDFTASIAPCPRAGGTRKLGGGRRRRGRHTVHTPPTVKLKGLFELLSAVAESREVVRVFDMKLAIRRGPRQLIPMTIACLTYLAHQAPFSPLEKPDHFDQPSYRASVRSTALAVCICWIHRAIRVVPSYSAGSHAW